MTILINWSLFRNSVLKKGCDIAGTHKSANSFVLTRLSCRTYGSTFFVHKCTTKGVPLLRLRSSKANNYLCAKLLRRFSSQVEKTAKSELDKNHNIRRLVGLAKHEKWKIIGAIGFLLISSTVTMAVPFALGRVIDTIYTKDPGKMRENLDQLAKWLLAIFVVGGLCNFGRVYFMSIAGQRITRDLRHKVFGNLLRQEVAFFDKSKTGELINRLSADTTLVSQSVTSNISDGLRSTVMVASGVSMMFYMSPELAAVGLSIVPPVAALAVLYGRFVRRNTKQVQDSSAAATSVAQERVANIRTVKAFSCEDKELAAYKTQLDVILQLAYKESLARGLFFGMTGLSGNVIILTVLYYGGLMVSSESLTVGNLSSFLLYAAYIGVSIGGLSSFYSEMNKGLGASSRLWQIIDRQPTVLPGDVKLPEKLEGSIRFRDVCFCYPARPDANILDQLNLDVPAGSITAIVGSSGSGKSSIASLLLRLYDPQRGCITVDGLPISTLDPLSLHSRIGFVSQEPVLFSCSVYENIAYGLVESADLSGLTKETVIKAAKQANCYKFITDEFPDGFDTLVGERGVMLSGGQKQRIAIARALVKDPRILILDEATSALDAESEYLVQEALERIMVGRTVLTIAHRLSTIRNADQIAVLEGGKIVEIGAYEILASAPNGAFRKLIKHQTFL